MPHTLRGAVRGRVAAFAAIALLSFVSSGIAAASADAAQIPAVQAHLMWDRYSGADVDRQMDVAKAAGAKMLRVDVGWASLERDGKGRWETWYLNKLDAVVAKAEQHDLKLLLTFWETPCWASTAPDDLKQGCTGSWWSRRVQRYTPVDPRDYADALAFVVSRYGSRVAAWEIWNEPNLDHYFKAADPVSSYAGIVRAAYPAAKAAYPGTTILAGSLADADYKWTEALYAKGVHGYFDAWSIHPYSGDLSPLNPREEKYAQYSFIAGVPKVRETLLAHGDDKPIWLTEFGWSTCTLRGLESWANCVDEQTQATYLKQAYNQMRNWSYVPVGVWFNLETTSTDLTDRIDNYGLLRSDGTPKPAYAAFREAAAGLEAGAPTAPATDPATTDPGAKTGKSAPKSRRLKLKVVRTDGRIIATGHGPSGTRVFLSARRYVRGKRRFKRRASYRTVVQIDSSGRFKKHLPRARLGSGRWRITAVPEAPLVNAARALLRAPAR